MEAHWKILANKMPLQSLPVLGFFSNYPVEKFYSSKEFYLICGTSDNQWAYLCGESPEDLTMVLQQFSFATLYFANVEDWMIPALTQNHGVAWKLTTHRFYLPDHVIITKPSLQHDKLPVALAEDIFEKSAYKDYTSIGYLKDRIKKDVSTGIWENGQLVGWGLTHG